MSFTRKAFMARWLAALPVYRRHRAATMIERDVYCQNLALVALTLDEIDADGLAFVECGTWRGGMSAGLVETGGPDRDYHFFDSFEGLPPASDIDGAAAASYQRETDHPDYLNNCAATLEEFQATLSHARLPETRMHVHKGWFEDTLPTFSAPPIAVLRIDGDWYESTMTCLSALWDAVVPGGLVLLDDYGSWEGCTKAMHDFLSERKAVEFVQEAPLGWAFYIRKR